jgi:hypothetical protein
MCFSPVQPKPPLVRYSPRGMKEAGLLTMRLDKSMAESMHDLHRRFDRSRFKAKPEEADPCLWPGPKGLRTLFCPLDGSAQCQTEPGAMAEQSIIDVLDIGDSARSLPTCEEGFKP